MLRVAWMSDPSDYIEEFSTACIRFGILPDVYLLRCCMAIAFADNAGSDPACRTEKECGKMIDEIIKVDPFFEVLKKGNLEPTQLLQYYRPPNYWSVRHWDTGGKQLMTSILNEWESKKESVCAKFAKFFHEVETQHPTISKKTASGSSKASLPTMFQNS